MSTDEKRSNEKAPIVFMDTETTGLSLDDDIWEFAAIRREPDGEQAELHLFVDHDRRKCAQLPESFREDHNSRYRDHKAVTKAQACIAIQKLFGQDGPKAHVVGAVPNFDTERIARMFTDQNYEQPRWHYHLIDVENLAVGYIMGASPGKAGQKRRDIAAPPWNSDELAALLGVTIDEADRHTALGDARWAMRIYDAVMGGVS